MLGISRIFGSIKDIFGSRRPPLKSFPSTSSVRDILQLKVVSSKIGIVFVEISNIENGKTLKKICLENILQSGDSLPADTPDDINDAFLDNFKLIRVKTKKEFGNSEVLMEMEVENGEEFFLITRRAVADDPMEKLNLSGPTQFMIDQRTAKLPKSRPHPPPFNINDMLMQDDMRKVFVTLAQESARVLGLTPFADSLIAYRQRIHNHIKNDKNAIQVMVKLGFRESSVLHAMKLTANHYKLALDWLIQNETSTGTDESLSNEPRTSMTVTSARRKSILSSTFSPLTNAKDRIDALLEIVHFYAEKDEVVYDENIALMKSMGYDTETSQEALRITRNNVASAVAFILGDDNPSIIELRCGLAMSSTVRQKFMESPEILTSLSKPRFFSLYVSVLDFPSQYWNPYSDIGSLMTHIIVTYQEEKHFNATNQFNQSRLSISALSA